VKEGNAIEESLTKRHISFQELLFLPMTNVACACKQRNV